MNQIINGEALETLISLPSESVDIVMTSPPYNFGMDYNQYDDTDCYEDYLTTVNSIFSECNRVLKSGGRMIINVAPSFPQQKPTHHHLSTHLIKEGMKWMGEIIWNKNNFSGGTAWGSWKSPSQPTLTRPYEFLCLFAKDTTKHSGKSEDVDITAEEFLLFRNAIWNIQAEVQMRQKYDHPAMFPEELVYRVLKMFSYQNDVVLDPFNGAGTTTFVASKMNRNYIGIDMDAKYCETARKRILTDSLPDFEYEVRKKEKSQSMDIFKLME